MYYKGYRELSRAFKLIVLVFWGLIVTALFVFFVLLAFGDIFGLNLMTEGGKGTILNSPPITAGWR